MTAQDSAPQPAATTELAALRRTVNALTDRTERLETTSWHLLAVIVSAVLVAGLALPFGVEHHGDDEETAYSVLSIPFATRFFENDDGGIAVLFSIGFIGLAISTVVLIVALLSRIRGTGAMTPIDRVRLVAGVLVLIGSAVTVFFTLMFLRTEAGGWGGVVLAAGAIAALAISHRDRTGR